MYYKRINSRREYLTAAIRLPKCRYSFLIWSKPYSIYRTIQGDLRSVRQTYPCLVTSLIVQEADTRSICIARLAHYHHYSRMPHCTHNDNEDEFTWGYWWCAAYQICRRTQLIRYDSPKKTSLFWARTIGKSSNNRVLDAARALFYLGISLEKNCEMVET